MNWLAINKLIISVDLYNYFYVKNMMLTLDLYYVFECYVMVNDRNHGLKEPKLYAGSMVG